MKSIPLIDHPILCSFPPVADKNAQVLILGSMPGAASLKADQYYAHPRNLFWPIMGELIGAYPSLLYEERLRIVRKAHIALWESLATCIRPGSLDSAITQEVPNDFVTFFKAHPKITRIYFNGAKAEQSFRRSVLPTLDAERFTLTRLPSTSPAHAAKTLAQKLEAWRVIL